MTCKTNKNGNSIRKTNGRWNKFLLSGAAAAALAVLALLYFTARELHRRGTFVDDTKYAKQIEQAARRHKIEPQLLRAVIFQESRFDAGAIGRKGEAGLMQIMQKQAAVDWARASGRKPPTHAELLDVDLNLEIGAWYLAKGLRKWQKYKEQIALALIQYNAGEKRADRWKPEKTDGDVISRIKIASTKVYVTNVLRRYHGYLRKK